MDVTPYPFDVTQPPAVPEASAAPTTRRSRRKTLLVVLASVLLLACAGGGLALYFTIRTWRNTIEAPRAATEAYMRELQAGDTAAAYGGLCADDRRTETQEQFEQAIGRQKPTAFEIVSSEVTHNNGVWSAEVIVRMTYATGLGEQKIFRLSREDTAWKICGGSYD